MRTALCISGSDPTGGAGLQLDLQVCRAFGVHGMGVPTALTIQDTHRVHRVLPSFPSVVLDQIRVLLADIRPDAIKIGMLATDDVARSVLLALEAIDPEEVPIVLDPVLAASDGTPLLEPRAWAALRSLCGRARLVTPNRIEAERLTGCDTTSDRGAEEAARRLLGDLGARAVLVKGGHRAGSPRDLLVAAGENGPATRWLEGERIAGDPVHGTGCALASAVAAGLARGGTLEEAVSHAHGFVREAIAGAESVGAGARILKF